MGKINAMIQITRSSSDFIDCSSTKAISQQANTAAHKKSVFDGAGVPPTGEKEDGDQHKTKIVNFEPM